MSLRSASLLILVTIATLPPCACGQGVAYNPYADSQDQIPPVAPDGTIHWGTFYKSAAMQKAYERLWNLGACRNTNKRITIPVTENKLVIDKLPEAEFSGVVRGAAGTLAGGIVAFVEAPAGEHEPPLVAQLHPAGVSRLVVTGEASADVLRPGMTVRLATTVDSKGRGSEPVTRFEIISPAADDRPEAVVADETATIVGTVTHVHKGIVGLRVATGKIRRLTLPLDPDAVATIDAGLLELVSAGDTIEVKGRRWDGEGAMGAGTVFATDLLVRKPPRAGDAARKPVAVTTAVR